jgi:CRP-like cAMP-binding protein
MQELTERLREIATERVAQRVARSILRLARKAGRRTARGVEIDVPLSREDLARLAGTTVFTVSRLMDDWEAAGIVEGGRGRVVIRFPHGLVSIAEDLPSGRREGTLSSDRTTRD